MQSIVGIDRATRDFKSGHYLPGQKRRCPRTDPSLRALMIRAGIPVFRGWHADCSSGPRCKSASEVYLRPTAGAIGHLF